jgi:hypothetical protein
MRYAVVARAKGTAIYGLRFEARGESWRILPGLKPRDAEKILKQLSSFGIKLSDDPTLAKKLAKEAVSYPSGLPPK